MPARHLRGLPTRFPINRGKLVRGTGRPLQDRHKPGLDVGVRLRPATRGGRHEYRPRAGCGPLATTPGRPFLLGHAAAKCAQDRQDGPADQAVRLLPGDVFQSSAQTGAVLKGRGTLPRAPYRAVHPCA